MSGNTFGKVFRVTTWGESHGEAIGVVVDGVPPNLDLSREDIQRELDRRKPGQSDLSSLREEKDVAHVLSGVFKGKTTGTPISMIVRNVDVDSSFYETIKNIPRPGHADFTYEAKYGIRDYRGGGRASARETIGRVAAGAIAKKMLSDRNIEILGHVTEIGGIRIGNISIEDIRRNIERNSIRCADLDKAKDMRDMILKVREIGDSIGGMVEIIALNVPPGLGEPVFDKLDADLAKALMSIGSIKSVEIGAGSKCARMKGSEMNDPFFIENGFVRMKTNNAGGILGGISTGDPIVCKVAVKPTPSISITQESVDLEKKKETEIEIKGRHDPCICPRIVPVAEAMVSIVLADHLMRNEVIMGY